MVVIFLLVMAAVLLALATRRIVRWEERLTDADESILAEWLTKRRAKRLLAD